MSIKLPVINVKKFGAVGDGVTDDTVALKRVSSAVLAASGGTIVFEANKTYKIWPTDPGVDTIFNISGVTGVIFEGNGAKILSGSGFSAQNTDMPSAALFKVSGCSTFVVRNLNIECGYQTLSSSIGPDWFWFKEKCNGIILENLDIKWGRTAFTADGISNPVALNRVYNVCLNNIRFFGTYFPMRFIKSGDNVTAKNIYAINCGRSYFPMNVSNHDIQLHSNQGGPLTDCLLKVYTDPLYNNTMSNIKLNYTTDGRYSGAGNQSANEHIVALESQSNEPTDAAFSRFFDIDIKVAGTLNQTDKANSVFRIIKLSFLGANQPSGSDHKFKNIRFQAHLSGCASGLQSAFMNVCDQGTWQSPDELENIIFENIIADTTTGQTLISMGGGALPLRSTNKSGLILKNISANGAINISDRNLVNVRYDQNKKNEVNVKDFGAVGDGTTDDTVAIQNAVTNSLSYYNKTVIIPHGIYKVSGTITIPQGVMLECPGSQGANEAYGTVFVHYSTGNLFLWNGASGTAAGTGGGLKNCTIYKASGYSGGDAIKLLAIDDDHRPGEMVFENILTSVLGTGMWQRGFHVDGTACTGVGSKGVRSVWFNKVRFTGCSENNQYVFFNQAVHVNGGIQIDQGGGSGTAGMSISGDSENVNLNCIINGNLIIYDNATHLNVQGRVSTVNVQSTGCIGRIDCTTTANITNNSPNLLIASSSSVTNGTRLLVGATGTSINDSQAKVKVYGPVGQPLIDLRATNSGGRVGITLADGVYGFLDYDPDSSQGVRLSCLNNGPLQLGQNSNAFYGSSTFVTGMTVTSGGLTAKAISVNEGSNMTMGTGVLVAGAVTISTTKVTNVSRIFVTSQVDGGTPGFLRISARNAGTDFTITSSSGTDTSTVAWWIVEPA